MRRDYTAKGVILSRRFFFMSIRILAFGIAREICNSSTIDVVFDENITVEVLKALLVAQYPALKQLTSFMIAVNGEYAQASAVISANDEVAIIPPVSGG
ncbi:MAG: molybdopterin synthase sulfur carrier subunit [Flavipsychrobacter sp.]|nr:molybdopterin synthase sulfur carrier subunit [Flavipsychrobacter sp.]